MSVISILKSNIRLNIFFCFSTNHINTFMRQYTARDIEQFINNYSEHVSHIVVAHTHFRPFNQTQHRIDQMAAQAKKDCRHALNCFAKMLHPNATNKPVRKPLLYKPLSFVTIENAKEHLGNQQTIHFNIALGNLPKVLLTEEVETLFRHAWVNKAKQADDVKLYNVNGRAGEACTWNGYALKEAQQQKNKAWKIEGVWDVENCWIPHAALNTD